MAGFETAAGLLPSGLRRAAMELAEDSRAVCEELRLRRGRPPTALLEGREYVLRAGPVTEGDLRAVLETASRGSLHAAEEQLRRGFLAGPGGVRVGVCGTAVAGQAGMEGVREVSSVCLRIPRAVPGCADGIWDGLTARGFASTLIASPPGAGKTTLLRELVRKLSCSGWRVGVADERGEIADAWSGEPAFDVGPATDVMTGAPKGQGTAALLRAMDIQVIAMDEIAGEEDVRALLEAVGCGVKLLATVHGERGGPDSPACRALLRAGAFRRRVWVERVRGARRYTLEELPCA